MKIIHENEKTIKNLIDDSNAQEIKVCIFGIDKSGKSAFLKRIESNDNFNNFKESIKIYTRSMTATYHHHITVKYRNRLFELNFWENPGQLKYLNISVIFCSGCSAILNFYDPFNKNSFELIKKQVQLIKKKKCFPYTYILVKSKWDLNETKDRNIMVSDEEVLEYAYENNLLFRNLSNIEKYGSGIEKIIEDCIDGFLSSEK